MWTPKTGEKLFCRHDELEEAKQFANMRLENGLVVPAMNIKLTEISKNLGKYRSSFLLKSLLIIS